MPRSRLWTLLAGLAALTGSGLYLALRPLEPKSPAPPAVRFRDITPESGIAFTHTSGAAGDKLLPETMGAGVAVIDYDGDGRPDLLFVNGRPWPGRPGPLPTLALYRNLGGGEFRDVTAEAGLAVSLFGMGACVGDFDNDGRPDLFITAVGGNRLFRNVEGKRFVEVTEASGLGGSTWPEENFFGHAAPVRWSTSATFLDYDGDGLLDLFVCDYVAWSPKLDLDNPFTVTGDARAYGPPRAFGGASCRLYRNLGGGKFRDVSSEAGVLVNEATPAGPRPVGKALGVVVCDIDGDGWPDIVVANDTVRNFLFHNRPGPNGTRRFEEVGIASGVAYADGRPRGAMGIDWSPGPRGAIAIGNFADEPNTFLRQTGPGSLVFEDVAASLGLTGPSRGPLKFGLMFLDYDLDGRPDLFTCNGHLDPDIGRAMPNQLYAQSPQLFWNTGRDRPAFVAVTAREAGEALFAPMVGRGCACLDLDGDGAPDVVLTANGGPARLLRNEGTTGHWLRLRLIGDGRRCNVSAIGARVTLEAGGRTQVAEVCGARGYLSQGETAVTFGLGPLTGVDRVTIRWPGANAGPDTVLTEVEIDRETVIRR